MQIHNFWIYIHIYYIEDGNSFASKCVSTKRKKTETYIIVADSPMFFFFKEMFLIYLSMYAWIWYWNFPYIHLTGESRVIKPSLFSQPECFDGHELSMETLTFIDLPLPRGDCSYSQVSCKSRVISRVLKWRREPGRPATVQLSAFFRCAWGSNTVSGPSEACFFRYALGITMVDWILGDLENRVP